MKCGFSWRPAGAATYGGRVQPTVQTEQIERIENRTALTRLATSHDQATERLLSTFYLLTEGKPPYYSSVTDGKHLQSDVSKPPDLVQGTLVLLLLKILALQPLNGFAISQRLRQASGDKLQVSDGSLYPALHKLEQEGWVTAEWRASENNRRAKFYSLTRRGRRELEKEVDNWDRLSTAISQIIKLKEA